MTRVLLTEIAFNEGTQIRASLDTGLVAEYAEAMTDGAQFPPVVLFHDGNRYYLADGFHRYMAAQRIELRDIDADIHPGTKDDALWFALGANRKNGKRLNDTDKRHAIVLALQTWPERSQTQLAEQIGCTQGLVSQVISANNLQSERPSHVTGKDGKRYPASRATKPKADAKTDEPFKSRANVAKRKETIAQMADEGYTSDQIAQAIGLSEQRVGDIANEIGVTMHPAPISYQRPYLFSAAKVQRVLDGTEPAPAIYPRPNRRKRGTHVAA